MPSVAIADGHWIAGMAVEAEWASNRFAGVTATSSGANAWWLQCDAWNSSQASSIRNDASIPEEVKKKLLAPLEQANKEALDVAEAQAEQEEKAKIIEASSEDSEAIRKAGEEIAASADTEGTPPAASAGPTALSSTDEATGTTKAALADSATQTAPAPEAPSSGYSTSPPTSAVGANVDIQA